MDNEKKNDIRKLIKVVGLGLFATFVALFVVLLLFNNFDAMYALKMASIYFSSIVVILALYSAYLFFESRRQRK